ncbi:molybdate ABC transporter substrate-binding protein [Vibrio sp. SCSIO 43137]|uniref:molybdate ABC transporter substrate-binding protein n=1 Tax=Vibrio sp. SCSIO 43137 TaxID=3021011 RepID=UPI002306FA27|nr:molybdate ABC transporter substrate-binding protein [Vibrio sp. SCSIO 43137]WCE32589.1 molybdate ABC transporter substrate-binding protein [Vibrio sp. SCSIO 43137]
MYKAISHLFISILFAASCSVQAADKVRLYAAASMTNVINEVLQSYKAQSGDKVVAVFAGSSSLARQIEKGAPADIYISANVKWVDYLIDKGMVYRDKADIVARNQLSLVKPANGKVDQFDLANAEQWLAALKNERLAVGQVDSVPAGIYAKQALSNLGVWQQVRSYTAPTNSVRVALALVERGEAALGVVYQTDAMVSSKVVILDTFPEQSHTPVQYPMAVISGSKAANKLAQFILSDTAQQIFEKYGFSLPKGEEQ